MEWQQLSNDQRKELVRPLLRAGMSGTEIANELGVTKNVICGFRMRHLPDVPFNKRRGRPPAPKKYKAIRASRQSNGFHMKQFMSKPKPVRVVTETFVAEPIRVLAREVGQCAWIDGDPRKVDPDQLLCCGQPTARFDDSWCPMHRAMVWNIVP